MNSTTPTADVHLGDLDVGLEREVPMYMSTSQFAYWRDTHLTVDVVPGRGAGFSVEAPGECGPSSGRGC